MLAMVLTALLSLSQKLSVGGDLLGSDTDTDADWGTGSPREPPAEGAGGHRLEDERQPTQPTRAPMQRKRRTAAGTGVERPQEEGAVAQAHPEVVQQRGRPRHAIPAPSQPPGLPYPLVPRRPVDTGLGRVNNAFFTFFGFGFFSVDFVGPWY